MTDESIMPWGKYKGQKMANIPASYLKWLYDEGKCNGEVKTYIEENLDIINTEIDRKAYYKKRWDSLGR